MQINVLLPSGTRTVNLEELKELVRQGVVQPSTLLETGGQQGKAKNVPALKPIFAELAAQPQPPEPPAFPSIPTPPETPRPLVFPSTPTPPEAPETLVFPQFEQPLPEIETSNTAPTSEPPSIFPEISSSDNPPQFPSENNSFGEENSVVFPQLAPSSSVKSLKAIRAAKLEYWVKWGRGFLAVFDVAFALVALVYFVKSVFPAISDVFKAIDTPFYKETLLVCGSTFFVFLLAAFGYGLATILFRILFAATALYAASCEEEARNNR